MRIVVTGSSGHLGEGLVRALLPTEHQAVGVDRLASPFTRHVGSVTDRDFVRHCLQGADAVIHAATLHKPHVATHTRQEFVDTNITGTLNLLEEAVHANVQAFVFTSTTSAFGHALTPAPAAPAVWVTEDLRPVPKNIYGVTKTAAEDLCELIHDHQGLPCLILRTSRFFLEADDDAEVRRAYDDDNLKVNEYLFRRVDLQDVVDAHLLAIERAPTLGFGKYIVSATTPFEQDDAAELREHAAAVVGRRVQGFEAEYARRAWRMFPSINRIYVNDRARRDLGWNPRYDFRHVIELLAAGEEYRSPLAQAVGSKGYHAETFTDGPYPVA